MPTSVPLSTGAGIDAVVGYPASCACGRFGEGQSARRHAVPVRLTHPRDALISVGVVRLLAVDEFGTIAPSASRSVGPATTRRRVPALRASERDSHEPAARNTQHEQAGSTPSSDCASRMMFRTSPRSRPPHSSRVALLREIDNPVQRRRDAAARIANVQNVELLRSCSQSRRAIHRCASADEAP